ncbi:MAG: GNAT family N-acetyltransferase [Phycisphaerae bacterium]|nr:GNAT family N-acetyltransferase [Phycisphaerae bacterium]
MNLRWAGEDELDRVAETRMHCYAQAIKDLPKFQEGIRGDERATAGDFLLAEQDGQCIGTATGLSMHMWMRGARLPIQGVAYVGTIRTARRGGVANQIMSATIAMAREREQVITALMPFRASYYERFGYGFAEQRTDWTIPLALMPSAEAGGLRYATEGDRPVIAKLRQQFVEAGQCDIETTDAGWALRRSQESEGFQIIGEGCWAMLISDFSNPSRPVLRVTQAAWKSTSNLKALLSFLGSQRDQFGAAFLSLPTDFPLNRLLRETQLPHRPVSHLFAEAKPYTRMQIRVLNHRKVLEALHLPISAKGKVAVAITEPDGEPIRLAIDFEEGRITARPFAGECEVSCSAGVWASIVSGDLSASTARGMGLIPSHRDAAIEMLDVFAKGPTPFCNEYF